MSEKIYCSRCQGSQVVPQSGDKCVKCNGSGYKTMQEILFYIHVLEKKVEGYEDSTHGKSGRIVSSNAEAERDAANEYATDAKAELTAKTEQIASLEEQVELEKKRRDLLATQLDESDLKNAALEAVVEDLKKAGHELYSWTKISLDPTKYNLTERLENWESARAAIRKAEAGR